MTSPTDWLPETRNKAAMCGDCFDRGWVWEGEGSDLSNQYKVPCPYWTSPTDWLSTREGK